MDTNIDRRTFCKGAIAAASAFAVAPIVLNAVEPQVASAGTTCTCNVSCDPDNTIIDALIGSSTRGYMTNPNIPLNGGFPTSPVSGNASYEIVDGKYQITVNLVNTMFQLLEIAGRDDSGDYEIAVVGQETSGKKRITSLVITSPVASGSFTVSTVKEYAGYALIKQEANWPILVEFSI